MLSASLNKTFPCFVPSISLRVVLFASGALRDMTNSWDTSFIVIGVLTTLGSITIMHEPLIRMWWKKKQKRLESKPDNLEMTAASELLEK